MTDEQMQNLQALRAVIGAVPSNIHEDDFVSVMQTFAKMMDNFGASSMFDVGPNYIHPVFEIAASSGHVIDGEEGIRSFLSMTRHMIGILKNIKDDDRWDGQGRYLLIDHETLWKMTYIQRYALRDVAEVYKDHALKENSYTHEDKLITNYYLQPDAQGATRRTVKEYAEDLRKAMEQSVQGVQSILSDQEIKGLITAPMHSFSADAAMKISNQQRDLFLNAQQIPDTKIREYFNRMVQEWNRTITTEMTGKETHAFYLQVMEFIDSFEGSIQSMGKLGFTPVEIALFHLDDVLNTTKDLSDKQRQGLLLIRSIIDALPKKGKFPEGDFIYLLQLFGIMIDSIGVQNNFDHSRQKGNYDIEIATSNGFVLKFQGEEYFNEFTSMARHVAELLGNIKDNDKWSNAGYLLIDNATFKKMTIQQQRVLTDIALIFEQRALRRINSEYKGHLITGIYLQPDARALRQPRLSVKIWAERLKKEMERAGQVLHTMVANAAMATTKGGIDLNSANLAMVIKRDGKGVPLPIAQQDMAQLSAIQGFDPQIIEIRPAVNVPIMSELQQKLQPSTT